MSVNKDIVKFFLIFTYVLFATYLAWFTNHKSLIGIDDANIYMVYMQNFANGHGFVYNIGGEKVEGFTSLLWTLLGSLSFSVTQNPEIVLLAINIIMITYALWKLVCYIDNSSEVRRRLITPSSLLLLGLLFIIPGYFDWTILSLLETGVWSSLLILISLNLLDSSEKDTNSKNIKFHLFIILLIICRPEGILWGAWFILAKYLMMLAKEKSMMKTLSLIVPSLAVYSLAIICLIIWREYYFGFPFPNTFYAKVSSDLIANAVAGVKYIFLCFVNNPLALLSLLLVIGNIYAVRKLKDEKKKYVLFFTGGIVFLTFLIPLYTGGDHFGLSRFMQPAVPLILFALILNFNLLNIKINYYLSFIFITVFSFANKNPLYNNIIYNTPIAHEWKIAIVGRKASEMLNLFFEKQGFYPSQGVVPAGGTAFAYKGFTIDLLGLNNVEMAHASKNKNKDVLKNHASFNKQVFYKQAPDIVWYSSRYIDNNGNLDIKKIKISSFERKILQNIHQDKQFKEMYTGVVISNKYLDYSLLIIASKQFLNKLDQSIYSYKTVEVE